MGHVPSATLDPVPAVILRLPHSSYTVSTMDTTQSETTYTTLSRPDLKGVEVSRHWWLARGARSRYM